MPTRRAAAAAAAAAAATQAAQEQPSTHFDSSDLAPEQAHRATPPASASPASESERPTASSSRSPPRSPTPTGAASESPLQVNGFTHAQRGEHDLENEPAIGPEPLEQANNPSTSSGSAHVEQNHHTDAEGECFSDEWLADMRRVKVYELVGQRWTDRGTALCTGIYDEELDQASIVARSELTEQELLKCEIRMSDVYQRQQETLIVWTEPDGTDYALSFQDVDGCAEIWDFIIEVQRHFRGKLGDGPSSSSPSRDPRAISASSIVNAGRLPEPTLGILGEIDKAIKFIGRTPTGKEKICDYIISENYVRGLIDVLAQAEDLEALHDLHALCNLMQTIMTLNDHNLYEYLMSDELYMGVLGTLEYDPEYPTLKASYREYLQNTSQYKEVVTFREEGMKKKIMQTYRLQFLKDVVMARTLDDPTYNVLNSFILFNQIDIINHIQTDEVLLRELFERFESHPEPSKPSEKEGEPGPSSAEAAIDQAKRDVIVLLHQLCTMGKNVQIPARLALYRSLVDKGMLHALYWALSRPLEDQQMLSQAGEILLVVCDHDVNGVRAFILKQADPAGVWEKPAVPLQAKPNGVPGLLGFYSTAPGAVPGVANMGLGSVGASFEGFGMGFGEIGHPTPKRESTEPTLLTGCIKHLTTSKDLALRSQMYESLRTILELPIIDDPTMKNPARMREDPSTEKFLQYFYDSCVATLYRPLTDVPEFTSVPGPVFELTRDQSSLLLFLCDNLCNLVVQHSHRSQFFVLSSNISKRVATLFKAKEKHLRLAALRFFRVCVRMNNNLLLRRLINNDLFGPILEVSVREARRDNLINASCQEFFEHIRRENIRIIINHVMDMHESKVRQLCKYGSMGERFRGFVLRWEQNNEPPPKEAPVEKNGALRRLGRPGQGVLTAAILDAEQEDDYFNGSDDDEAGPSVPLAGPSQSTPAAGMKRKRSTRSVNGRPRAAAGIVLPSPYPLKLVDYDDPEEESQWRDSTPPFDDEFSKKATATSTGLTRTKSVPNLSPEHKSGLGSPPQKRRRDEEEDEVFGMLKDKAVKKKSPSPAPSPNPPPAATAPEEEKKGAGGVMKKIKLSLGRSSFGVSTTPTATTPEPEEKENTEGASS